MKEYEIDIYSSTSPGEYKIGDLIVEFVTFPKPGLKIKVWTGEGFFGTPKHLYEQFHHDCYDSLDPVKIFGACFGPWYYVYHDGVCKKEAIKTSTEEVSPALKKPISIEDLLAQIQKANTINLNTFTPKHIDDVPTPPTPKVISKRGWTISAKGVDLGDFSEV